MSVKSDLVLLGASIVAMIGVALSSVMGILTLTQFKETSVSSATTNSSIDDFINGIIIVGTFMEIIMLVLVATIIIRLAKASGGD